MQGTSDKIRIWNRIRIIHKMNRNTLFICSSVQWFPPHEATPADKNLL